MTRNIPVCVTLLLSVLLFLAGCASSDQRVPLESYEIVGKSDSSLLITLTTGSVEYGGTTRMVSAGNNVYVTAPGEDQPDWAYGPSEQRSFVNELKTVLDNNAAFARIEIDRGASEVCCDAELNVFFVSTEQKADIPIYYLDVVVTFTTQNATFENRHEIQSNTIAELYLEWQITLDEARDRANDKLMRLILADLNSWLER